MADSEDDRTPAPAQPAAPPPDPGSVSEPVTPQPEAAAEAVDDEPVDREPVDADDDTGGGEPVDEAAVGITAWEDVDDGRDTADFTAVTAFLRRRGVLRPARPTEPILVPRRPGILVPAGAPGATPPRPLPPGPSPTTSTRSTSLP